MTGRQPPSRFLLALLLAAATLAVFARVNHFEFLNYDDPLYVTVNPHVQQGLSVEGVRWAFTTFTAANWHPLTWISLMLDASIGGTDPFVFHLTNLVLHLANVLLLFSFLDRITGRPRPSAVTAALFAIHPLHVESVAWIAERKDVLSTLFLLLTLMAYARFVEQPDRPRRLAVVLLFALGLLAKPMLVTLPVLLLLLDAWPLRRSAPWRSLVLEKLPLFAMSIGTGILTFVAQRQAETVGSLAGYPLGVRVANAIVATATYLGRTIWPTRLAVFYPHPGASLGAVAVAGSAVVLFALTSWAIRLRRSRPYLFFGWGWYLVTLAPVVGIVQVGWQARADRYTYIPLIGIFLAVVWAISESLADRPALLSSLAWRPSSRWASSLSCRRDTGATAKPSSVTRSRSQATTPSPTATWGPPCCAAASWPRRRDTSRRPCASIRISPKRAPISAWRSAARDGSTKRFSSGSGRSSSSRTTRTHAATWTAPKR